MTVIENISGKPSGVSLTQLEKLFLISTAAGEKFEALEEEHAASDAAYDARQKKIATLRDALGDAKFKQARNAEQTNSTKEGRAKDDAEVAAADRKLKDYIASAPKTGTGFSGVRDFLYGPVYAQNKWRAAVVPEPQHTFGGDDLRTLEELKSQKAQCNVGIRAAERAPVLQDRVESQIKNDIRALCDEFGELIDINPTLRMQKDASGRMTQGHVRWPRTTIVTNGRVEEHINAAAIVAEVFGPAIENYLLKKALSIHDPAAAMQDSKRRDTIAELRAEVDMLERQAEIVVCRLARNGVKAERLSIRPEVILGIERI